MSKFDGHYGFQRMFQEGKMTLGFHIPLEAYEWEAPTMERQVELVQAAEDYGFTGIWLRDVILQDPAFGDPATGQIYDMMIYLTYLAAQTKKIAFGTSSIVLPLRHPLRVAKETATIENLFPQRLMMGISSGDRRADFHGLNVPHEQRAELFRDGYDYLQKVMAEDFPKINSPYGMIDGANLVPKSTAPIPTFITGYSQQTMDWFAQNGDGWIYYPRDPFNQAHAIQEWRELVQKYHPGVFKPFIQPLHLDLAENPDESVTPIRLGYRVGRKMLLELLAMYQEVGVNHLFFALFPSKRPIDEVIDELGQEVLPYFPAHIDSPERV
ncbi:LLM class oxidoreductase [Brevibacillus brevis]|uniref:LLM class oxidoreductase n=1 Tax=Brevibacillus brevis TaxID=1393 RepID=A0A2Z4MHY2_BREBE|nr:LLM class oxidoreductase [Brevibacillus brevis]AWX56064.1 LLM class oxidoreductase [Brevibacillus brevis]